MSVQADAAGTRIEVHIDPNLNRVIIGDQPRLQQVLSNLVANAVKFTTDGDVVISVSRVDIPGLAIGQQRISVEVVDTGIGIDDADMARLFDSYPQADPSMTRRFGGTGLGLSIAHRLTALMGGTLAATSTLGHGSTFRFESTFEIAAPAPAQAVGDQPSDDPANAATNPPKRILPKRILPKRILVVDDNEINRMVVEQMLAPTGFSIATASSGEAALALHQREPYDLILLDSQMPGLSGIETTRHLRDELHLDVPIIGLSAAALDSERAAALEAGMNDYLTKPIDSRQLTAMVIRWLGRAPG